MATAVNFDTVKKGVVALLLASDTAYGTGTTGNAPDGSIRSLPSATEFSDRILEVDEEVCSLITQTVGHPYQSTFVTTSGALNGPSASLPARTGAVLQVLTLAGKVSLDWTSANVSGSVISIANHGLVTGQKVRVTSAGTLPAPLAAGVDYYIIRLTSGSFSFASTLWNANASTAITLTNTGSGTSTLTSQFIEGTQTNSKDTAVTAFYNASVYTTSESGACGFWYIEGDTIYTSSPQCKVVYADVTKGASPQAPSMYEFALIAGTVAKLLKDGGASDLSDYYAGQYQQYLAQIGAGATVLPAIEAYKG